MRKVKIGREYLSQLLKQDRNAEIYLMMDEGAKEDQACNASGDRRKTGLKEFGGGCALGGVLGCTGTKEGARSRQNMLNS